MSIKTPLKAFLAASDLVKDVLIFGVGFLIVLGAVALMSSE
jgi:hypothetical protein